MPSLLIFDCDGVLIDSEMLIAEVESELRTELGFPITPEEYLRKYVGLSTRSRGYTDGLNQLPPGYFEIVTRRVREKMQSDLRATPGALDLVVALKIEKAIASSSTPEELEHSLKLTGLYEYFRDRIYSVTMVAHPKPAPDIYRFVAGQTGHPVERCLVIEDSLIGTQSAHAAGMEVLGFTGAAHAHDELPAQLKQAGAAEAFPSMSALQRHLRERGLISDNMVKTIDK